MHYTSQSSLSLLRMRVQSSYDAWTLTLESQIGVCQQKQASLDRKCEKKWKWQVKRKTTEFSAFS